MTLPSALSPRVPHPALACTSLAISDSAGNLYHGRTLELTEELPCHLTYYPTGTAFRKLAVDGSQAISYSNHSPLLAITTPMYFDGGQHNMLEGFNGAGLSFSANMVREARLDPLAAADYPESIPVTALGEWALSLFSNVEQVTQAVNQGCFWSPVLKDLGGAVSPFHFAFYDKHGGSIVVEAKDGKFRVYNNPTRAMTNSPEFSWHLMNLNNYTQLTNKDCSVATLGNIRVVQPDSGIATAALPASDTSVDRFIRAVFYTSYAPQADSAAEAVNILGHIMNRFDRLKNITTDDMGESGPTGTPQSEYTLWTSLSDLSRGELYIRSYSDLNYNRYSLAQYQHATAPVFEPLNP